MASFISHNAAETEAFARQFASVLQSGCVIGLSGDLGAGKTQFVKGVARGLGVVDPVHSPTFSLLNIYGGGRLPLYHLDLYRLETHEQILAAGLEEYFRPDGVTVVEWIERWQGFRPDCYYRFHLESLSETDRRIDYEDPRA
jgi:tRNA threonylcarbamoyladenosine biosynthesis protein TsaE